MLEKVVPINPGEVVSGELKYIMNQINELIMDKAGTAETIEVIISHEEISDIMDARYGYSPVDITEIKSVVNRFKLSGWSVIPCGNTELNENKWYFTPKNKQY